MFNETKIEEMIVGTIRDRIKAKSEEPDAKPLYEPLFGEERLRTHSIIQSFFTSFGMKILENIAEIVAESAQWMRQKDGTPGNIVTSLAQTKIDEIMNRLETRVASPNMVMELSELREVATQGVTQNRSLTGVDLYLTRGRDLLLIDVKTVKPNSGNFKGFKRQLLEWAAAAYYRDSEANVTPFLGMPYNPFEPNEYEFMTSKRYFNSGRDGQLKVGPDFWNFLGDDESAYGRLVACFQRAGDEVRDELEEYIKSYTENP